MIAFPPYRLDVAEQQLWKGDKLLALRKKPFAILSHLAANPKRLVTAEELLEKVWQGAVVSDSAMRTHLHELRQVLGEGVIETVVGRGYRFIAEIAAHAGAPVAATSPVRATQIVVGREAPLASLRAAFERAASGKRVVCFVSGDPGIGKTTLVDAFVDELEDRGVLAVRGHCVEQFGTPEPYLAIIEAIAKLRRSPRGEQVLAAFARHAPTFLAQVPQLVPDDMLATLTARAQGSTEARMMREIAEALEVTADQEPVVIVLEDLHWSDLATIDLLSLIAQRTERAKLMVVATVRKVALASPEHPVSRVAKTAIARLGALSIAVDQISGIL